MSPTVVREMLREKRNLSTIRSNYCKNDVPELTIRQACGLKDHLFGVKNYIIPNNDILMKKPKNGKTDKAKKISFIEQAILKKKNIPGPTYLKVEQWD